MYLTKLEMSLHSRKAVAAITDCQKMHQLVCGWFGTERQTQNILYRTRVTQGSTQIYLYSEDIPTQLSPEVMISGQRELSQWLGKMAVGQFWGFDLLTMPCKKVYQSEKNKNSRRQVLRQPEERQRWLQRKAEQNGFVIVQMQELEQDNSIGRHSQERGGTMHWDSYHYQGVLQIADTEQFHHALKTGIGPGKAYGLGMLLLRTV